MNACHFWHRAYKLCGLPCTAQSTAGIPVLRQFSWSWKLPDMHMSIILILLVIIWVACSRCDTSYPPCSRCDISHSPCNTCLLHTLVSLISVCDTSRPPCDTCLPATHACYHGQRVCYVFLCHQICQSCMPTPYVQSTLCYKWRMFYPWLSVCSVRISTPSVSHMSHINRKWRSWWLLARHRSCQWSGPIVSPACPCHMSWWHHSQSIGCWSTPLSVIISLTTPRFCCHRNNEDPCFTRKFFTISTPDPWSSS